MIRNHSLWLLTFLWLPVAGLAQQDEATVPLQIRAVLHDPLHPAAELFYTDKKGVVANPTTMILKHCLCVLTVLCLPATVHAKPGKAKATLQIRAVLFDPAHPAGSSPAYRMVLFDDSAKGFPKGESRVLSLVAMSLMANAVMAQQADAGKPQKKFSETRDPVVTESTTTNGITSLRVASADGKELATSKIDLRMHYKPATEASKNIRRWESYEFGAFIHFNLNTFVGDEFAQGPASLYRPSKLNVPSWAKLFRQAGMGYAVLTTRHTSEFLLWPSKTSTQTVTATVEPTDVVKAFVESCRKEGVAPDHSGIYRPEDCAMILELKKAIADPSMYPAALNLNAKATASNIYRNDPTYGPVSAVDDHSATRWATDDGTTSAWLEVDLGKPATLGRAVIEQAYPELKRIRKFAIEYQHGNEWKACYQGENPGKELDVTFDPVSARHVRLNIIKSTDGPTISEFQLYPPAISN